MSCFVAFTGRYRALKENPQPTTFEAYFGNVLGGTALPQDAETTLRVSGFVLKFTLALNPPSHSTCRTCSSENAARSPVDIAVKQFGTSQAVLQGPAFGEKQIQPFSYDRLADALRLYPGDIADTHGLVGDVPQPPAPVEGPPSRADGGTARGGAAAPESSTARGTKRRRGGR